MIEILAKMIRAAVALFEMVEMTLILLIGCWAAGACEPIGDWPWR